LGEYINTVQTHVGLELNANRPLSWNSCSYHTNGCK